MKKLLDGKGAGGVAALVSACAGILALVVYLIYNLVIGKFTADVFVLIVLGVIFALVTLTTEFKFAPVLSVLGFGLAFGLYVNNRIIMFEELINNRRRRHRRPGRGKAHVLPERFRQGR